MTRDVRPISGKYADVWQAAEYLRVSVATIRKMQTLQKLTRHKVGRRVLVLVSDLESLVVAADPDTPEWEVGR
jgi:excisionase family DNA binding protein